MTPEVSKRNSVVAVIFWTDAPKHFDHDSVKQVAKCTGTDKRTWRCLAWKTQSMIRRDSQIHRYWEGLYQVTTEPKLMLR